MKYLCYKYTCLYLKLMMTNFEKVYGGIAELLKFTKEKDNVIDGSCLHLVPTTWVRVKSNGRYRLKWLGCFQ